MLEINESIKENLLNWMTNGANHNGDCHFDGAVTAAGKDKEKQRKLAYCLFNQNYWIEWNYMMTTSTFNFRYYLALLARRKACCTINEIQHTDTE